MECMKKKARDWQVRLLEDIKKHRNGKFITLTFNTDNLKKLAEECDQYKGYDLDNAIATLATRRFLERWRKTFKKSLRHFFITELGHGDTEHMHIHGIIWTDHDINHVPNIWQYGYVWTGKGEKKENYVTERTVNYIIKYILKIDKQHRGFKPLILTSPGIGACYMDGINKNNNKYQPNNTDESYKTRSGHNISLPIYLRNKLYTDEEREKLWLEKLDKQIRFVNGEKVSVASGEKEYYKLLEWHRKKNKELGYGDDSMTWEQYEYEKQLRQLKIEERINKGKDHT